jgi:transcriptional regulator with XRE-family HTH domain
LAKKTGLQPSAVSHFETGERAPSFENLRRLADALSVSIDYLLGRAAQPPAAGAAADKLYRNFEKMTSADQQTIAHMAEFLARQNAEKLKDAKEG